MHKPVLRYPYLEEMLCLIKTLYAKDYVDTIYRLSKFLAVSRCEDSRSMSDLFREEMIRYNYVNTTRINMVEMYK